MAEPIKQDTMGQVATVGGRALTGALIGAAVLTLAFGGGAAALAAWAGASAGLATAAGVVGGIAGLVFGGGAMGTVGMIGGAVGGLSGVNKVSSDEAAYDAQVRKQERILKNGAGKAKDQGFQEGVMVGYQQAAADMQSQQQMVYQQGVQAGAAHVVEQIQQQHAMMEQQAEQGKGSFADKVGCKPCASKAEMVETQKAEAANQQHGLV